MHSKICVPVVAVALLSACGGDSTSPTARPQFAIVAGSGATDSVSSLLSQALVVEVRNDRGDPRAGVVVRFDALPPSDSTRRTESAVGVTRLSGSSFTTFVSDTTDAFGRAKVLVRFGTVAGSAHVLVSVPELGTRDTARFTVVPGAASKLIVTNRDAAVFVGGTFSIDAAITDRFNNRRAGAIDFTAGPSIASVDANGKVTVGSTPGRGFVALKSGFAADTVRLSVVPRGTLVVANVQQVFPSVAPAIASVELDGSGYKALTNTTGGELFPKWAPAGDRVIFNEGDSYGVQRIFTVDLTGRKQQLIPGNLGLSTDNFGQLSKDGMWIYFSGRRPTDGNYRLFRMRADGFGFEAIALPDFSTYDVAWRGNLSPDGTKLVYVYSGTLIRVVDVNTRAVTRLDVNGQLPQWSPDGQHIAYVDQYGGRLRIMRANGTDVRPLTTLSTYGESAGFGFSSDGQWIVTRGATTLELINVADGSIIPLPYGRTYYQPSFKP